MPDVSVANIGPGSYDPHMEARLARLEEDWRDVKASLARLEPMVERLVTLFEITLPHLATKADVADLRTEMHDQCWGLRAEVLSRLP